MATQTKVVHSMRQCIHSKAVVDAARTLERKPCTTMRAAIPTKPPTPSQSMLEAIGLFSTATLCSLYFNAGAAGVVVTTAAGVVVTVVAPGAAVVAGAVQTALAVQHAVFFVASVASLLFQASSVACLVLTGNAAFSS